MEGSGTASLVYNTPVGVLKLEAKDEGICSVKWLSTKQEDTSKPHPVERKKKAGEGATVKKEEESKANEHLKTCTAWLDAYFDGTLLQRKLPKPPLVLPMKGK